MLNQLAAVKAEMGLAVLPCYLRDPEADLSRATAPIAELTTELWLITHQALKGSAPVRAFKEIVGDGIRKALSRLVHGTKNGR